MQIENTFKYYGFKDIQPFIKTRAGEEKLGERIAFLSEPDVNRIADSKAQYVLFGIPEDIGIRANCGVGGASESWEPFLKAFLNVQSNRFLSGENVLLLGAFDFSELMKEAEDSDLDTLREMTSVIDKPVSVLVRTIKEAGKIPVAVGGGHNNSYGMIRGCSEAAGKPLNVVNCDPHSDFRSMEGRHSGNGFRYAAEEGYLDKYAIIGLHEGYNSEANLKDLASFEPTTHYSFFEDIFIRNRTDFVSALNYAADHIGSQYGIELDLDSIAYVPVSAVTPSGISVETAREYLHFFASRGKPEYVHVCEAAPGNLPQPAALTGKIISCLITDFIKSTEEATI